MTDKELRKLSRGELLEMLLAQSKEAESLRSQLEETTAKLESRNIDLAKAGSIADAALELNGVFAAAQAAADQYLENVSRMTGRQEEICAELEAKSKAPINFSPKRKKPWRKRKKNVPRCLKRRRHSA